MSGNITFKMPVITVVGFDKIHVENFRNIIKYDECELSLTTGSGVVHIQGCNLEIMYYDQEEIAVKGIIQTVLFK